MTEKEDKDLILFTPDEFKEVQHPIQKAVYFADHGKPVKKTNSTRVQCKTCGKVYTRTCKKAHERTMHHKVYEKANDLLRALLLKV